MQINFLTNKLVVIHYPAGAGGKFIAMALALHPRILLQDKTLARADMEHSFPITKTKKIVMWTFEKKKKTNSHVEFVCSQFAGFSSYDLMEDITSDEKKCNELWKQLTNQDKFYFFMTENKDAESFSRYPNRKIIKVTNYKWILQPRRKIEIDPTFDDVLDGAPDSSSFDMLSIKEKNSFIKEINKTLDYLGLDQSSDETLFGNHLDDLRKSFLETFTTGFNDPTWQGFNKGGN